MDKIPVGLDGKVIRFENGWTIAVVETKYGEALLDINVDFDLRLNVGDEIDIEDADFYIQNGRIVTVVGDEITINDVYMKHRR